MFFCFFFVDVSGLSQRWNKLRRRCASFKAVSGPTSLDADASYILTEPVTQYAVMPSERHQRAASVTPSIDGTSKSVRPFSWRKSHSVEKYEYRDVNLNSSIPEKINKTIPLPDDYWKVHEQDVKLWKIGCGTQQNRPMSMRDIPKDSTDWEFNVQKFETLNGDRRNRIQYYTGDADTNRKQSLDSSERKEIKFPSLKAFKSASMRLPGQKSSLQEVHQMLRNKFNRLNVGLRKKRTLSVQEVFQSPASQQKGQAPSQFYVPSPMPTAKNYNDDTESQQNGDMSSLPYCGPNASNAKPTALNNQTSPERSTLQRNSLSPKNGDVKPMARTDSRRAKTTVSIVNDEQKPSTENGASSQAKPQFVVGGRVSLREKMPNKSTATKISNAVRERIRRRPRSHSPVKPTESPTTTKTMAGRKNRDSIGFLGRINRIMSVNHLPPPHSTASNNNNSTNNNMNRSKATAGSHESTSRVAATTAKITTPNTKKVQNDETKSTVATIKNNENGTDTTLSNNKQQPQTPDTIFIRDRKTTNKQVKIE